VEAEGVTILRSYVEHLATMTELPALSFSAEPLQVVGRFLDTLTPALRVDLAWAKFEHPSGNGALEAGRTGGATPRPLPRAEMEELGRLLDPLLGTSSTITMRDPFGKGTLRIAAVPSPFGDGFVVAGSRRETFPTSLESTVLGAVTSQVALSLRLSRLVADSRRMQARLAEREDSQTQLEHENAYLQEQVEAALSFGGIIGKSEALRRLLESVELVAPTDATVLILGESGTGKELLAREIHSRSQRAGRALIKVNCSAIPREMFESEFFGHVRGAFTGAVRDRPGRFKLADKGTIFLDEVGDLPLDLQPKLLRVLQEGQYERVGDDTTHTVDVRVIAATNRDLRADVKAGRFREDLYYRLSVFPLHVPPLRDRRDDIVPLAMHFMESVAKEIGAPVPVLSERQAAILRAYDWPGNVRELQNVIERAVILGREGREVAFDLLLGARPERQETVAPASTPPPAPAPPPRMQDVISEEERRRRERENLLAALERTNGRIYGAGGAAALLGLKPTTLQSRLRALGIRAQKQ